MLKLELKKKDVLIFGNFNIPIALINRTSREKKNSTKIEKTGTLSVNLTNRKL